MAQAITNAPGADDGDIAGSALVDWARTAKAVLYGSCVFGPFGTFYYPAVDRINFTHLLHLPAASSSSKTAQFLTQVAPKVAFDQLVFSPCAIAVYYVAMALLDGVTSWRRIWADRLAPNWAHTLATNLVVWPSVQALNFGVVPVGYRLAVVNVVSVGWNAFISLRNSRSKSVAAA